MKKPDKTLASSWCDGFDVMLCELIRQGEAHYRLLDSGVCLDACKAACYQQLAAHRESLAFHRMQAAVKAARAAKRKATK